MLARNTIPFLCLLALASLPTACTYRSPYQVYRGAIPMGSWSAQTPSNALTTVARYEWFGALQVSYSRSSASLGPQIASDGSTLWFSEAYGNLALTTRYALSNGAVLGAFTNMFFDGVLTNQFVTTGVINQLGMLGLCWKGSLYACFPGYHDRMFVLDPLDGRKLDSLVKPSFQPAWLTDDTNGFWSGFLYDFGTVIPGAGNSEFHYGAAKTGSDGKLALFYDSGDVRIYGAAAKGDYLYTAQSTPTNLSSWSDSDPVAVRVFKINLKTASYEKVYDLPINAKGRGNYIFCHFGKLPNGHFLFAWYLAESSVAPVLYELSE